MDPARRQATYDDLVALPEGLVGEIVAGELFATPRPASLHALASSVIGQDLGPLARRRGAPGGPGGWWILDEPELHLTSDVLVPDIAGWRHETMPVMPDVAYFETTPDWICEVVSPATARLDRVRKMPVYAREGVQHLWLVDPVARTLEAYRLDRHTWMVVSTHGGGDVVRVAPFEEIEIDLSRWWLDP